MPSSLWYNRDMADHINHEERDGGSLSELNSRRPHNSSHGSDHGPKAKKGRGTKAGRKISQKEQKLNDSSG